MLYEWRHLLSSDLPLPRTAVDFLVGISEIAAFITLKNTSTVLHKNTMYHKGLKLEDRYFGYILSGSLQSKTIPECSCIHSSIENVVTGNLQDAPVLMDSTGIFSDKEGLKNSEEYCNLTVETPLNLFLTKYFPLRMKFFLTKNTNRYSILTGC